jgi:hypothetical protein
VAGGCAASASGNACVTTISSATMQQMLVLLSLSELCSNPECEYTNSQYSEAAMAGTWLLHRPNIMKECLIIL